MPTIAIREAAMQAIATQLAAAVADVPLFRNRRSDFAGGDLPGLVLRAGDHDAQPDAAGSVLYTCEATVEGYVAATGATATLADELLEPALHALHARVVAALEARALPIGSAGDVLLEERTTRFETLEVEQSSRAIGRFETVFGFDLRAPSGAPFTTI